MDNGTVGAAGMREAVRTRETAETTGTAESIFDTRFRCRLCRLCGLKQTIPSARFIKGSEGELRGQRGN